MIVALSGTPGVGKTYVAKKIFKTLGWEHIELGKIIKQKKLYSKYHTVKNEDCKYLDNCIKVGIKL